jgi:hypothetical protein
MENVAGLISLPEGRTDEVVIELPLAGLITIEPRWSPAVNLPKLIGLDSPAVIASMTSAVIWPVAETWAIVSTDKTRKRKAIAAPNDMTFPVNIFSLSLRI